MQYILKNVENKLKKSVFKSKVYDSNEFYNEKKNIDIIINIKKKASLHVLQGILFNFLFFISKFLINRLNTKKNFLVFVKLYQYLNFFFFNNKLLFFKKYYVKKAKDLFYPNKFFLSSKVLNSRQSLIRLKEKKIAFYKKNIWIKKKKFRKKNILIFNKKFFKAYYTTRFNSFIVNSMFRFFKPRKKRYARAIKKTLYGMFHVNFYYLFSLKRYTFNKRRKRIFKKALFFDFKNKTYGKAILGRKFFAKRRWRIWRQVYFIRRERTYFFRILSCGFNFNAFDHFFKQLSRKNNNSFENEEILKDYFFNFSTKLAKKYPKDKNFIRRFFSRRTYSKRLRNMMYFYKWKPKFLDFHSFNLFNYKKNKKSIFFSLIWFKFFLNKIFWRTKKLQKNYILFFYKYFLNNKIQVPFNSLVKINVFFSNHKRIRRLYHRLRRRKFFYYCKKRRRRILKRKFLKKIIRIFLLLFLLKFTKKNKNSEKLQILKNAFFFKKLKKMNSTFLFSILFGLHPTYYNGFAFASSNYATKHDKDLRIISLLKRK